MKYSNLKSSISTTRNLKNALTLGFLQLLPNRATPLAMSLTIRPFGFVLLALLLPILWKFWPDVPASSLQPEISPAVEPSVEVIETSTPAVGTSEQPAPVDAPVAPEQGQGWSRAVKWGLLIVGAGAILIGVATIWYYWPIEPTVETVKQIVDQATTANYNNLRDALADNDRFHTYINSLNERDACLMNGTIYYDHWQWGVHIERKLWSLIGSHAKYPITKDQMAALLKHFNYSVVCEPTIDFVERMNHYNAIKAIPGPKGISLDEISGATSSATAKWQLVGYLIFVGGVIIVVTTLTR